MEGRWGEHFAQHLEAAAGLQVQVAARCARSVDAAVTIIVEALRAGGKLMLCGNGGSAADCQHMAAELTCRLTKDFERPAIAAIALTTDTSFLTGYANDYAYEGVFERQVEAIGRRGDVLLGISTSGASENVLRAVRAARASGIVTIALMGNGGSLAEEADHAIVVPSSVTAHVQEAMLPIEHVMCHAVERELFPD